MLTFDNPMNIVEHFLHSNFRKIKNKLLSLLKHY